jgi:hypothetical protein
VGSDDDRWVMRCRCRIALHIIFPNLLWGGTWPHPAQGAAGEQHDYDPTAREVNNSTERRYRHGKSLSSKMGRLTPQLSDVGAHVLTKLIYPYHQPPSLAQRRSDSRGRIQRKLDAVTKAPRNRRGIGLKPPLHSGHKGAYHHVPQRHLAACVLAAGST